MSEDNIKSFLEKIQELKEKKIKVDVLSTGKSIDCSPLSFKQQKDLISTIADGTIGSLKFQKYINEIIATNTGNSELLVTDKLPIIIKLRMDAIGNIVKDNELELDISTVIPKLKLSIFNNSKTITSSNITVELKIPYLIDESRVIQAVIDNIKKDNNDVEFGKNVGIIYTYEIVKYIKSIKFEEYEIKFSDISVKDRFKIVDNLPLSLNKEIISFIQENKQIESDAMVIESNGTSHSFDIDVGFFDT